MNNKGQVGMVPMGMGGFMMAKIVALVMMFVMVILIVAFFPDMQTQIDSLRGEDALNCESTTNICGGVGSNDSAVCYNSSVYHGHATTCAVLSIWLPLLLLGLVIFALGIIIS